MQRVTGEAETGNVSVTTAGVVSTNFVLGSFPSATISVFLTGTNNLASLFGDNGVTPKANPFTAASDGSWFFYAANGRYDITIVGTAGGVSVNRSIGDVLLNDFASVTVTPVTVAFAAAAVYDLNLASWFVTTLTGNLTAPTFPNAVKGSFLYLTMIQDGVGGRVVTWPAAFLRPPAIALQANAVTELAFKYDGTNWHTVSASGDNTQLRIANAIRFADQFASISAAISDLPAGGGWVMVPAGTYLDNIVITTSNIKISGYGRGTTIIKPSNIALPVLTIDATNVANIDGFEIEDLSILPVAATACDAGVQIKGKTNVNQISDHYTFRRVDIGTNIQNTTGTNNFRVGLEVLGRTIWSTFDRVGVYGCRGDGLNVTLTGGVVGPFNANYFTNCEFSMNYGYGVKLNTGGAVTLSESCSFINCNIQYNCNNTLLTPAAGTYLNGIGNIDLINCSWEGNCPASADANAAQIRVTGTFCQGVNILGADFNMVSGAAHYAIFNDAVQTTGKYDGLKFTGVAGVGGVTAMIHVDAGVSSPTSNVEIGATFNAGKIDTAIDGNSNTHVSSLSPWILPQMIIGTGSFPVVGNTWNLVTSAPGISNSFLSLFNGVSLNTITGGVPGQFILISNFGGAASTLKNSAGGTGQMVFTNAADRVLATNDWTMLEYDGTTSRWNEVNLGSYFLTQANTWTKQQTFSIATGTAPFSVASTTPVANLSLSGGAGATIGGMSLNQAASGNAVTLLNSQGPLAAVIGNATDLTLYTFTIPANTIGAGKGIRVKQVSKHTTGSGLVTYKLKLGATTLDTLALTSNVGVADDDRTWHIMNNAGVQNAQSFTRLSFDVVTATLTPFTTDGTSAENTVNALVLTVTMNAANTEQVTPKQWIVELIQ